MKVTFNNPGLYAVFIGEMLGQFSDGHWENSVKHSKDWHLYRTSETFFDENSNSSSKIRYNINSFFNVCAKTDYLTCIITRVLMIYNHGDLIKKVYETEGKEKADMLINVLHSAEYVFEMDPEKEEGAYKKYCEKCLEIVDEYFGDKYNFKNEIPEVNPENIKKFRKIGRELNDSFIHVKSFYELMY